MITFDCVQGSEEWIKLRTGIPSASNFDKIITPGGEPSKQRQKYLYTLASERITGIREEGYQNEAMTQGIERETEAKELYEMIKDAIVEKAGFCFPDEKYLYGASPDGLIGKDGLLEIKCPLAHTHIGYLLDGGVPREYIPQIQGQLLVTGRVWLDFTSYFPGLKPLIVRVTPDREFIKKLEAELEKFCAELEAVVKKIQ